MRVPRFSLAILLAAATILAAPHLAHAQGGCITGDSGCSAAPELDPIYAVEALGVLAAAGLCIRFFVRKRER